MRKKFGFTLAEVLITLGIIGVVAALTAPALVKNSGTAKIGPSLAKFVNTFETACEQMMQEEGVSRLTSISSMTREDKNFSKLVNNVFNEKLSHYMIMSPIDEMQVYMPDGSSVGGTVGTNGKMDYEGSHYQLKDGSSMTLLSWINDGWWLEKPPAPFKGIVAQVFYDINGPKGNNRIGKEVFVFFLDDTGILIPYGSEMSKSVAVKNMIPVCNMNPPAYQAYQAFACTGKIADNGYKYPKDL